MDPSSGQHQQMSSQSIENMLASSKTHQQHQQQETMKKPRPQPEQALNCPRCNSTNTKFCYYNNYSLSQPRYFCKSCRRYWTKGGTLRNVPVGGGCRKNKRPSSQSSKRSQDQAFPHNIINSPLTHFSYDHNNTSEFTLLASLASLQKQNGQLGFDEIDNFPINNPTNTNCDILGMNNLNSTNPSSGFLDVLRNGFLGASPNPNTNNNIGNLYYGYGNGDTGEVVENGNNNNNGEMVLPCDEEMSGNSVATTQAVTVTTMKQEMCNNGGDSGNNKVLWGFPWQINGGGDTNIMGEVDHSARASWNNGLNSSNWHGLLNSPLM